MQKIDSSAVVNVPSVSGIASQPNAVAAPAAQQVPAQADAFEGASRRQWAFARQDNALATPRAARDAHGRGHDGCCEVLLCSLIAESCCLICC